MKLSFERNLLVGLGNKNTSKSTISILGKMGSSKEEKANIDIDMSRVDSEYLKKVNSQLENLVVRNK